MLSGSDRIKGVMRAMRIHLKCTFISHWKVYEIPRQTLVPVFEHHGQRERERDSEKSFMTDTRNGLDCVWSCVARSEMSLDFHPTEAQQIRRGADSVSVAS